MTNRLSVLLAVHNEELHLAQAIQSVIDQTLSEFELLVVDDRSTDRTREIADSFAANDPRIRVFATEGAGKVDAYNLAYRESTGNAFCFFAGDDYLPPDSLGTRLAPLDASDPQPHVTICGYSTVSTDERFDNKQRLPGVSEEIALWSGAIIVWNRALANHIFPLPSHLPSEDLLAYYVALFGRAHITNINRSLYFYRIHDGNSYGHRARFKDMKRRFHLDTEVLETVRDRLFEGETVPPELTARIRCSAHSRQGSTARCLFTRDVPLKDRLRYAWRSNEILYDGVKLLMSQFGHK